MIGLIVFTAFYCGEKEKAEAIKPAGEEEMAVVIKPGENIPVTVVHPGKAVIADVLVLPGWKFNRKRWLKETLLVNHAAQAGYRLVCPEMDRTLYAMDYYPETKLKWASVPGRRFLREILIPRFQKMGYFQKTSFLLGLSTGGRGVALLALDMPQFWSGAAALSGDFDQSKMPQDRIMTLVFGSYAKFPERWAGDNNIVNRVQEMKVPLYLGHGRSDRIVPVQQSRIMAKAMRDAGKESLVEYHETDAGHDFDYWGDALPGVFKFFKKLEKSHK